MTKSEEMYATTTQFRRGLPHLSHSNDVENHSTLANMDDDFTDSMLTNNAYASESTTPTKPITLQELTFQHILTKHIFLPPLMLQQEITRIMPLQCVTFLPKRGRLTDIKCISNRKVELCMQYTHLLTFTKP